ncbi:hypothetical protein F3Y22_tig00111721pilonHSYRG00161 [Hibiscus syriacus]|uniref:DUF4283 domain-containing protein n=1 Tax=Hibiscus syriacus TaxID=106335 RepID=A0A6A2Y2K8_HIBSY|nr:hypothetical protein F3Y22_tig00111721pilonHSYRG00161 [Hibiscus syriacus]
MQIEDESQDDDEAAKERPKSFEKISYAAMAASGLAMNRNPLLRCLKKRKFNLIDLDNDYFLVKFENLEDYSRVLTDGPWMIYGSCLTVQPWSRKFTTFENTNLRLLLGYAYLVYPTGLQQIFFKYGTYGHARETCQINQEEKQTKITNPVNTIEKQSSTDNSKDSPFGPWMVVKPRGRINRTQRTQSQNREAEEMTNQGSIFAHLDGSHLEEGHSDKNREDQYINKTATPKPATKQNAPGVVKPSFKRHFKECVIMHKPKIIALMETYTSGKRADSIVKNMGYNNSFRIEAQGHSDGEDFNCIIRPEERIGGSIRYRGGSKHFQDFIFNKELLEVSYQEDDFTWRRGNLWQRLDRCITNFKWIKLYPATIVHHLDRLRSDHCPILLQTMNNLNGNINRPFRFLAAWMDNPDFGNFLNEEWVKQDGLIDNLNHFKHSIKFRIEELLWAQRAICKWINHGDKNTKYFHSCAITKTKRKLITTLKTDSDTWCEDQDMLKNHVKDYYENLFTSDPLIRHSLDNSKPFPNLTQDHWNWLDRPFEKNKIKEALFSMGPPKSPGIDGFHAIFFQKNWVIVGEKVCSLIKKCLNGDQIEEALNRTSLVLLPKVPKPERINQFRPISLCQVIYKIITKVIANRLKPILPTMISNSQTSFIPGMVITDNIILAQEVIIR